MGNAVNESEYSFMAILDLNFSRLYHSPYHSFLPETFPFVILSYKQLHSTKFTLFWQFGKKCTVTEEYVQSHDAALEGGYLK